jgi:hypothetical protein
VVLVSWSLTFSAAKKRGQRFGRAAGMKFLDLRRNANKYSSTGSFVEKIFFENGRFLT